MEPECGAHILMNEPKMGIDAATGPGVTIEITLTAKPVLVKESYYDGVVLTVTREWIEHAMEQLERGLDIYQRKITKDLEVKRTKQDNWFPGTMVAVTTSKRRQS